MCPDLREQAGAAPEEIRSFQPNPEETDMGTKQPPDRPSVAELRTGDVIRTAGLEEVRWPPTVQVVSCRPARPGFVTLTAVDHLTGEELRPCLQSTHAHVTRIERADTDHDDVPDVDDVAYEYAVQVIDADGATRVPRSTITDTPERAAQIATLYKQGKVNYRMVRRPVPSWAPFEFAPATEGGAR
jgi:hypothetical protein